MKLKFLLMILITFVSYLSSHIGCGQMKIVCYPESGGKDCNSQHIKNMDNTLKNLSSASKTYDANSKKYTKEIKSDVAQIKKIVKESIAAVKAKKKALMAPYHKDYKSFIEAKVNHQNVHDDVEIACGEQFQLPETKSTVYNIAPAVPVCAPSAKKKSCENVCKSLGYRFNGSTKDHCTGSWAFFKKHWQALKCPQKYINLVRSNRAGKCRSDKIVGMLIPHISVVFAKRLKDEHKKAEKKHGFKNQKLWGWFPPMPHVPTFHTPTIHETSSSQVNSACCWGAERTCYCETPTEIEAPDPLKDI